MTFSASIPTAKAAAETGTLTSTGNAAATDPPHPASSSHPLSKNALLTMLNPPRGGPGGHGSVAPRSVLEVSGVESETPGGIHACKLYDGVWTAEGLLLEQGESNRCRFSSDDTLVVRVEGYVTSEANYHTINTQASTTNMTYAEASKWTVKPVRPFLCVTSFTCLTIRPCGRNPPAMTPTVPFHSDRNNAAPIQTPPPPVRLYGGTSGTFFRQTLACFDHEELCGLSSSSSFDDGCVFPGNKNNDKLWEQLSVVQTFLQVHKEHVCAAAEERQNMTNTSSQGRQSLPHSEYLQRIQSFASSQRELQVASLTPTHGAARGEDINGIKEGYGRALAMAWDHAVDPRRLPLKIQNLLQWHAELYEGGGTLRSQNVRVGITAFTSSEQVHDELQNFLTALRHLEQRCHNGATTTTFNRKRPRTSTETTPPSPPTSSPTTQILGFMVFAAAALFGINDIHPFLDGNGRLSRLVANWALARCGVPFFTNWFANRAQRADYIGAIRATLRNIMLVGVGDVSPDLLSTLRRRIGLLRPLVDLVTNHLSKAVHEFLQKQHSPDNNDDDYSHISSKFRRAARTQGCVICLDDNPNIATLCCGKAVHVACLSTWLQNKQECPHCRDAMPYQATGSQTPPPPQRPQPPSPPIPARRWSHIHNDDDDNDDDVDTVVEASEDRDSGNEDTTTTYDHSDSETTTMDQETAQSPQPRPQHQREHPHEEDTTTAIDDEVDETTMQDTTITDDGSGTTDNDTTELDTTEDTTVVDNDDDGTICPRVDSSRPFPRSCAFASCRLRPARACTNKACKLCCQRYGRNYCERHNTYIH